MFRPRFAEFSKTSQPHPWVFVCLHGEALGASCFLDVSGPGPCHTQEAALGKPSLQMSRVPSSRGITLVWGVASPWWAQQLPR